MDTSGKGEALHEMIPCSLFHVISDAGHLVIEEQPDQLTEKDSAISSA